MFLDETTTIVMTSLVGVVVLAMLIWLARVPMEG
jgi:hypothetical protein